MASDLAHLIVATAGAAAADERSRRLSASSASIVYDVYNMGDVRPPVRSYHIRRQDDDVFRTCVDNGRSESLPPVDQWRRFTAAGLRAYFTFEGNQQRIINQTSGQTRSTAYTRGSAMLVLGTMRPAQFQEYQNGSPSIEGAKVRDRCTAAAGVCYCSMLDV